MYTKERRPRDEGGRARSTRTASPGRGHCCHHPELEEAGQTSRGMWSCGPVSDSQPPYCGRIHFCCLKPPGLWSFVTAALGHEYVVETCHSRRDLPQFPCLDKEMK